MESSYLIEGIEKVVSSRRGAKTSDERLKPGSATEEREPEIQ